MRHRNPHASAAWQRSHAGVHDDTRPRADVEREAIDEHMSDSPLLDFDAFEARQLARFDRGAVEYGDRSYSLTDEQVLREIECEDLDVCGWAFFLWIKGHDPGTAEGRRAAFRRFLRQAWHTSVHPPPERFTKDSYALFCVARALYGLRQAERFRRQRGA